MPALTVRNLPDEIHRALRVRAARNGRSTEAEIRQIIVESVRPPERLKIGSYIRSIALETKSLGGLSPRLRRSRIRGAGLE